jgi:hypothetical protein
VVGIATGSEGVGLQVGRAVELRHRHVETLRELPHDAVVLGHLLLAHRLGPRRLDGDGVGEPVRPHREDKAEQQPDHGTVAAEERPDDDHEPAEEGEQDVGLDRVFAHLNRSNGTGPR